MGTTRQKMSKRALLIVMIILVFLISIIRVGISIASTDSFKITNAEIISKSPAVRVNSFDFEKCKVNKNITFYTVGDSITYRIKLKNNDETSYTIKAVSDDNENKYISYEYGNYEGKKISSKEEIEFDVTEKYTREVTEMENRNQKFSVNMKFTLEDENGSKVERDIVIDSTPKTGDNIGIYILTATTSLILLIFISSRNMVKTKKVSSKKSKKIHDGKHGSKGFKLFSLVIIGALILPTITRAKTNIFLTVTIENDIALKDKLLVSYKIDNRNYELIIPYNSKVDGLTNPEKDGYTFDGWVNEDGTYFDFEKTIKDDVKLNARFTPLRYTISYDLKGGALEYGKTNPTEYTPETNDIELNKPKKEGYVFAGWTGTELTDKTENVTISKGSIGNREYTANWKIQEYTINYRLEGGVATGNPTTYTIESDDIHINNPEKEGYVFVGWTGTELTDKTENVVIAKGSAGDKEFIANWIPIEYSVTYRGLTTEEERILNNPTKYTVETESVTLNNPQDRKDSDGDVIQKFMGWKDGITTSETITLPVPGEHGNKIYEAVWVLVDPNKYTITYELKDGILSRENPIEFTKFDTFTLNNPTKDGYRFEGWTGSNGNTPQTTVTIPVGVRQDLNYTANWAAENYTITTKYEDGSTIEEIPYTIESNEITLHQPNRAGYTFKGWTGTDVQEKTMEVTIQHGSIGNKEYVAHFDANKYEIVFDRNTGDGSMPNEEMTYDNEKELIRNTYTKTGYTFDSWNTKADGSGTSFGDRALVKNLTEEDSKEVTLYAQWNANTYTVVFNKNNADATGTMENQFFKYDQAQKLTPNAYSKANYTFKKWNTKPDGSGAIYEDNDLVSNLVTEGEIVLYAEWEGDSYVITFEKNNDDATGTMENQTFIYDIEQNLAQNTFTSDKYNFVNWNTEANGNGTEYINGESVSNIGNTTLYAQWNYTITYNANNGTGTMVNQTLMKNEEKNLQSNSFTREKYAFNGWNTKPDGTGTSYTDKQLVSGLGNTTLYAQWKYIKNKNTDNTKLKSVGNFKNTVGSNKFSTITAFKRSATLPDASVQTFEIADRGSIKGWYDGTIFYWYSESEYPLLDADMGNFFNGCAQLTDISGLEDFDSTNVKYMQNIIRGTKVDSLISLRKWDVLNVERIDFAFCNTKITSIEELSLWNVSKVKSLEQTFNGSPITDATPLRNWDVSNVTNMDGMFSGADLQTLDGLERWDVSKVTKMQQTFHNNKNLTSISGIANWKVSNLSNVRGLFKMSSKIESIEPLRNWNVSNLTNMSEMLAGVKVTSIDALSNWNVSTVTNFYKAFDSCSNVTDLEALTNWDVSNGTNFEGMFYNCKSLTSDGVQKINNWNLSKTANFKDMFRNVNNKPTFTFDVDGTPTPGTWNADGTLIVP